MWTYYDFDPQGNVLHRLNSSGGVASTTGYDAYGALTSGAASDPFGYNGRWGYYIDSETGLCYCQNRYYDPTGGRWLTRDPIGFHGGMNMYGYAGGCPIGQVDPEGLENIRIIVGSRNAGEEQSGRFIELARHFSSWLRGLGHTVSIVYEPSKGQLRSVLKGADSVIFIGHGNPAGLYVGSHGGIEYDLHAEASLDALGGRKLRRLVLFACDVFEKKDEMNKWAKCGKSVWGSPDTEPHAQELNKDWSTWLDGGEVKYLPEMAGTPIPLPPIWPK